MNIENRDNENPNLDFLEKPQTLLEQYLARTGESKREIVRGIINDALDTMGREFQVIQANLGPIDATEITVAFLNARLFRDLKKITAPIEITTIIPPQH